ncbi:MAG TPA: PQQ-binding-like beta-propeller repeat protein [Methylophilaceae bacterium]|nr:PQQ-binding-like beta-propeller repeat protein [Methylophilaceae bacterium]
MKLIRSGYAVLLLLILSGCVSQPVSDNTTNNIRHASNAEWPSFGRDYSNQRYSPLSQINTANVGKLAPAWHYHSGVSATFQATPIVVDGVMYVSLPYNHVVALDAKTGKQLWRYEHQRRPGWRLCCGPANRGVAVGYGMVFMGTVDARLVALDARTGQVKWDIDVVDAAVTTEGQGSLNAADPLSRAKTTGSTGVGIAMAPIVYNGKVLIGITGVGYGLHIDNPRSDAPLGAVIGVAGLYGRPGFMAAFDVHTGKRIWQFDTIPSQGWEGEFRATTPEGVPLHRNIENEKAHVADFPDAWRYGGGSAWSTPAIDPKRNLLFFGTGNPSPQMNDLSRPGDNLYTVSLIALDADTGKLRWYYQQVPHDLWGYDLASPPVLFDLEQDSKSIPAVAQASKTGWLYVHNRETGKLLLKSEAFVPQHNLFAPATREGTVLYPGILGGASWSPTAVNEAKQTGYVAAMHSPIKYTLHEAPAKDGQPPILYAASEPTEDPRWGLLSAIDLGTGKISWQHKTAQPLVSGVLATAGGLLFVGEGNGSFDAYDAATGKLLWQDKVEAGVNAPAVTYEIDGTQYVAVVAGGNSLFGFKAGDNVLVYALPK